jgi:hypothetical protein
MCCYLACDISLTIIPLLLSGLTFDPGKHSGIGSKMRWMMSRLQGSSVEDSLFEKTVNAALSRPILFLVDMSHSYAVGLPPPHQFRPLSVLNLNSSHSPVHEDDTMISVGVDHFAHEFFTDDDL